MRMTAGSGRACSSPLFRSCVCVRLSFVRASGGSAVVWRGGREQVLLVFPPFSLHFGSVRRRAGGAGVASSTACGRACGFRRVRVGFLTHFLEGRVAESHTRRSDNRSVMPLDVRGRTRATLEVSAGTSPRPERAGKPLNHLP